MNPKTVKLKNAYGNLRSPIDEVLEVEAVLPRRGKLVAQSVPVESEFSLLPDLKGFRDSIQVAGRAISEEVVVLRGEEQL